MSDIKDQIITLVKQRHHSHKVALEQEKDPRSKHAIDLIARIREDSQLIELIDSLPEEKPSEDLEEELNKYIDDTFTVDDGVASIPREERHYYLEEDDMIAIARHFAEWGAKCKENAESFTSLEEAAEEYRRKSCNAALKPNIDGPTPEYGGSIKDAFIAGAEWQKEQDKDWLNEELIKAHLNGVMTGDRIAREESQMPLPEDTVNFMKGVEEGRRLEREDFQGNLSWRDIKRIIQIADNMLDDPKMRVAVQNHSEEEYYKSVWKKWRKTVSG